MARNRIAAPEYTQLSTSRRKLTTPHLLEGGLSWEQDYVVTLLCAIQPPVVCKPLCPLHVNERILGLQTHAARSAGDIRGPQWCLASGKACVGWAATRSDTHVQPNLNIGQSTRTRGRRLGVLGGLVSQCVTGRSPH